MINHIENIRSKIQEVSGDIVIIELKLRLLAEINPSYREELYRIIKENKRKLGFDEYWNCHLQDLVSAIDSVFSDKLSEDQKKIIDLFRGPRNKVLHGDFVGLLGFLDISQDGQEIFVSGKRNQLIWIDKEQSVKNQILKQAINRFENNESVKKLRELCNNFDLIINELLRI